MKIYANAKVNLALDVVRRRADGYHELDMVMAPLSLKDTIDITPNGADTDRITCDAPLPETNTVTKAMAILREEASCQGRTIGGYDIHITKRIPEQAGLAGGSADAAAVIKAVNRLEGLGLGEERLYELGARVGADVPFCIAGRTSRVRGIGELIRPIDTDWGFDLLLVKPEAGVSTPAAFARWEETETGLHDIDLVEEALHKHNAELLLSTMVNSLEPAAMALVPELEQLREEMTELGLVRVMMTGSGSAMMGFSVDQEVLENAALMLRPRHPFVQVVHAGTPAESGSAGSGRELS